MIDAILAGLVLVAAIFGLIRGIISQFMAIAGLVTAYFLAPELGKPLGGWVQFQIGSSRFMAEKVSIFFVGVAIYLVFRMIGFGIEKLFVKRIEGARSLNRWGGALLGATKAGAVITFAFFFITLLPRAVIRAWVPKLLESHSYKLAARFNPMAEQAMLERMRALRTAVRRPEQMKQLQNRPGNSELSRALQDQRFVKSLQEGDYESLARSEDVEKMMNDKKLVEVLAQLEKPKT